MLHWQWQHYSFLVITSKIQFNNNNKNRSYIWHISRNKQKTDTDQLHSIILALDIQNNTWFV